MVRFTFKLARKSNPKKHAASITVFGKSKAAAKSAASRLLGPLMNGKKRTANRAKKRSNPKRRKKVLNFGQRMLLARKRAARRRKR